MEGIDTAADTLSMKEKLELFKKQKNDNKKENVKPVPAVSAKVTTNKSSNKSVSTTSTVENKLVRTSKVTATSKVLPPAAAAKPIASSSSSSSAPAAASSTTAAVTSKVVGKRRNPTAAEIKAKMDEYVMLAQTAGIEVGRSFMEAVPIETNMKGIETHAIYWLTWTRVEAEAKEWSQLEALFVRARVSVTSASGLQALNTAEKQFQTVLELHQKSTNNGGPRSSAARAAAGNTRSTVGGVSAKKRATSTSSRRDSGVSEITDSTARSATLGSSSNDDQCLVNWMGEDGFSIGELAPPKALRFSLGGDGDGVVDGMIEGTVNNDSVPDRVSGVRSELGRGLRSTSASNTATSAAAKIVAMVLPKERKNVIKPMGRCGGVFEHVNVAATTQVYENASASAAAAVESGRLGSSSGISTVAANIARLNGLSLMRGAKAPSALSGALSGAVALPGLSHAPIPAVSSMISSSALQSSVSSSVATMPCQQMDVAQESIHDGEHVGASLDVLLGLGADESMIEEEPIGSAININNVNHSSNNINDSNSSNNNNHNNKIENITTVTTTSSSTNQDNSRTAKENHQPSHNDKRTTARQPRRRVQLGSSDIFSDDDDDDGPSHSISSSTVNVSGSANNQAITSAAAVVGKRGRTVNEDKDKESTTSTSKKLRSETIKPSAPVPVQPLKTTAKGTKKVSMVSFSECPVVSSSSQSDAMGEDVDEVDGHRQHRDSSYDMDRRSSFGIDSMTDAFHCTTLASGGRNSSGRKRTSSGGASGGGSSGGASGGSAPRNHQRVLRSGSKKIHRKGTPYAAADRPRFHRPATLSESDMMETEIDRLMDTEPGLGPEEYGESRVRYGGGRRSGSGSGSGSGYKRSSSGGGSVASSGGGSGGSSEEIYGSYLTHVMSCVDIEMDESQFDLLATTPPASALAVRRSRRLSHAASSAMKENE